MRRSIPIFLFTAALACLAEDITTLDKKTFTDVTVRKIEADGIIVTHAGGGGRVAFTNLDEAARQKYKYDPAKATGKSTAVVASAVKNSGKGRLGLVYRIDKVEEAQAQARREGKPISFIMAEAGWLEQDRDPRLGGSHASTVYLYEMLKLPTVVVFIDCREENHQGPMVVDNALHAPDDPARIPPKAVVVDASMENVIGTLIYTPDPALRQRRMLEVLTKIKQAKK